jgi:hypothetical protein
MTFTPSKNCNREDCSIVQSPGSTTLMYYPPIFDKYGKNTNPDGNITTYHMHCTVCNMRWIDSYQFGKRIES